MHDRGIPGLLPATQASEKQKKAVIRFREHEGRADSPPNNLNVRRDSKTVHIDEVRGKFENTSFQSIFLNSWTKNSFTEKNFFKIFQFSIFHQVTSPQSLEYDNYSDSSDDDEIQYCDCVAAALQQSLPGTPGRKGSFKSGIWKNN